ncbi:MAG: AraC family transcriptional regulator [Veillonellaceae bacterium]|nr:AraC family transcriptional regulator [Veillonellaceae bacterium]
MRQTTAAHLQFQDFRETLGVETVYGEQMGHEFPRHTHRSLGIGLVEQGKRIFRCRGEELTATPGQLFVIPPQVAHTCESGAAPHTYRLLMVCPDVLTAIMPELNNQDKSPSFFTRLLLNNETLFENLLSLHHLLASDESLFFKQATLLPLVGAIVAQCIDAADPPATCAKQQETIARVKSFMDDHYADDFSLADLASRAHLSPYHFLRVFTACTGIPPHLYQQQVRIRQAKNKLLQGASLSKTAVETGFGDQSHFSNVFKKMVGITPGEYVKSTC